MAILSFQISHTSSYTDFAAAVHTLVQISSWWLLMFPGNASLSIWLRQVVDITNRRLVDSLCSTVNKEGIAAKF